MVRYACTDMSYVSSKNMGDDDKDLDWTIFDTYYQGFWYLNLNPFEPWLGEPTSQQKYIFVPSLTFNEISAQTIFNPCVHTIRLEVDTCFLRSSWFPQPGSEKLSKAFKQAH